MTTHRLPRSAPAVRHRPAPPSAKRVFDVLAGAVCVLVFLPLLLVAALLVRLSSPGDVIFRQSRLGRDGEPFVMYKFRTMVANCDDAILRDLVTTELRDGAVRPITDPRVTRVGRVLRRASIDELPQLFNVLRGEMSLVGPRPMLDWELELLDPGYRRRLAVRPGITGLWQVSGRNRLTLTQRMALDLRYVDEHTFGMDLRILARTVIVVLSAGGAT
ncbi:hypothetical protein Lfu02_58880 [Longispora fulva]|uniref:Lipopolysaccharide/colanic/teichoic acid biosynthesis glycosyltransferase n=1 Tax=Longispora fulva TaxID=619741 RepID=A0A8J7KGA6_9ACTN|nr:sugar transferase [Longispora fulva]MBG6137130.1 lipopolysaccharide/colanic/teichoic acid biosynthesis glycosyltransferase [Longispora fulva]GIG61516.1 hypothetical protein Lfu02_58880 [Longispora fulva]